MYDINLHSTTYYHNLVVFLKERLVFKHFKRTADVIDTKMLLLREKIKEYLASLQVENFILNYHVHALT
jgi:hypothetical protein